MNEMADFFAERNDELTFYRYSSHFWRYLAYENGKPEAVQWIEAWKENNPGKRLPSILAENFATKRGVYDINVEGRLLNAVGFLKFEEKTKYNLGTLTSDGLVLVGAFQYYDEGGDEYIYNWWYADKYLNEIRDLGILKHHTYTEAFKQIYGDYREKALALMRQQCNFEKRS